MGGENDGLFYAWANTWLSDTFQDWNISDLLPAITTPSLIMQGVQDQYATAQHAHDIVSGIGSNASLALIEGCGHTPHKESEEKVLQEMAAFLGRLIKKQSSPS